MGRKTIIFGNGLGMAIDPDHFSLSRAIERVWNGTTLSEENKKLICQCLSGGKACPYGEDDLDLVQRTLSACDFLNSIGSTNDEFHWLSNAGINFPDAVRRFIFEVACSFHTKDLGIKANFVVPFVNFIKDTNSNVATLNYDNLIYQTFIDNQVFVGFKCLVDGFLRKSSHVLEFCEDNLIRTQSDFGYYLHLHGSPLFVNNDDGMISKLTQEELQYRNFQPKLTSSHLVLTHIKHKRSIIASSPLLTTYWRFFSLALYESSEIILFGYSGNDDHLNSLLSEPQYKQIPIKIVEWSGARSQDDPKSFWIKKLNRSESLNVLPFPSILDFIDWG